MTLIETSILLIVFITYCAFAGRRLMTYMHVLQQEDYDNGRLFGWIFRNKAFDKRVTFALLCIAGGLFGAEIFGFGDLAPSFFAPFLTFLVFVVGVSAEKDPRKNAKKALVATMRAKRIFIPAFVIAALLAVLHFYVQSVWVLIAMTQALPFVLILVNLCLQPFENSVQARYRREAQEKLSDMNPKVIGITGSYGKTSVKHILGHILSKQAPTLITPGSVNTPMGITRVIREQLEPNHEYLIVEMGAYGPGSIANLCRLTPPDLGIITSIGHAHYERFKSLDTVAEAKFELAQSVLSRGGKVVIHERTLRFSSSRALKTAHADDFIVCGDSPEIDKRKSKDVSYIQSGDLQIHKIKQSTKGLEIKMAYKGDTYTPDIPIFGLHHGHNVALAFAAAMDLGVSADDIQDALRTLPQIHHRLEVRKQGDGTTIIDDAYNSNPIGFQSALGILATLGKTKRKILITPGMIELGATHDEIHEKIGASAAEVCDVTIVVGGKRIPTFIKGFRNSGYNKALMEVDSFAEAQSWFMRNKQEGDVVLIENDLPDMYERVPVM